MHYMKDIFHNIISIKIQKKFSNRNMISLMFDKYSVWILEMKNENQVLICYVRFLHHWNQDEQTNPLIQFLSSNSKIIYSSRAYCKISKLYGWTYWRKGILEYTSSWLLAWQRSSSLRTGPLWRSTVLRHRASGYFQHSYLTYPAWCRGQSNQAHQEQHR